MIHARQSRVEIRDVAEGDFALDQTPILRAAPSLDPPAWLDVLASSSQTVP
jgi:hypothetical protein